MKEDLEAVERFLVAGAWIPFSGPEFDEDVHPAPPDETDVLFFIQTSLGNRIKIGKTSRSCGTMGPSWATHWMPLPAPPPCAVCPECDGYATEDDLKNELREIFRHGRNDTGTAATAVVYCHTVIGGGSNAPGCD